ncbi:MAG: InlB B-repeat-containing protein [Treponema sp.]|nr:InlB B-repeat-containing protein [Treponema sp.]
MTKSVLKMFKLCTILSFFLVMFFSACEMGTGGSVDVSSISITKLPNKQTFREGDVLDLTGLEVTAKYSDGSSKTVTDYTTNPAKASMLTGTGTKTVTVTYEGKTASFTITVEEKLPDAPSLKSIHIAVKPRKTAYLVGEELDLDGLAVMANYSDGSQKIVTGWTVTPGNGTVLSTSGTIQLTVTYGGFSATVEITVQKVLSKQFFWGTWVRMDNGDQYEVLQDKVVFKNREYDITASSDNEITVSSLGTFTKQSDSVLQNGNIPYFRNGGANLDYSLKLVGFTSSRAAANSIGGIKGKAKSQKYASYEDSSESDSEGVISFIAPTANDVQTVTIENGDELVVIPGLKISNKGDYMGTVALVGEDDYNLKITGAISDDQKDDGYLYGNNAKSYDMELTITNISDNQCSSSVCTIKSDDVNLNIESMDGTNLSAFTISSLNGGATKSIKLRLNYGELLEPYIDTGIKVTVSNRSGEEWGDYIPLRFFKGLIPITVAALSPEKNDDAALNGFIIYPDGNNQFFAVKDRASKILFVPSFGKDEKYMMVFSGATVTSRLSDSTEMYYSVSPASSSMHEINLNTDQNTLMGYMKFGGNNDSEDKSYDVNEAFISYLSEGEIDYYTITAEGDEFYAPGAKSFCNITYRTEFGKEPTSIYLPEDTALSSDILPVLESAGMYFSGWFKNDTKIDAGYVIKTDITLTAKWEYINYDITYNNMKDVYYDTTSNPAKYKITDETITLANPIRNGATFQGWYDTPDFGGNPIYVIEKGSTGNKILYARWNVEEYTITYNLNDGIFDESSPNNYTVETPTITLNIPTKEGYAFNGWFLAEDFSGLRQETITQGTYGDMVYYAKWLKVYSITYLSDYGAVPEQLSLQETSVLSELELPILQEAGKIFVGWYDGINQITNGYIVHEDLIIKARWNETWVNTSNEEYYFEKNELDWISNNQGKNDTEASSTWVLQLSEDILYTFEYSVSSELSYDRFSIILDAITVVENASGNVSNSITKVLEAGSHTLTASYRKDSDLDGGSDSVIINLPDIDYDVQRYVTHTITYNTPFGNHPETVKIETGMKLTDEYLPQLSETGAQFCGWFMDSNYITEVPEEYIITENIQLYAKWETATYTVTYVTNGGKKNAANPTAYTLADDFELKNPTYTGYVFLGWYLDEACTQKITKLGGRTGNITLYAKWGEQSSISVTLDKSYSEFDILSVINDDKLILTAPEGFSRYSWRVKGLVYERNDNVFEVNTANWKTGSYKITVIVQDGQVYQSSSIIVTIE